MQRLKIKQFNLTLASNSFCVFDIEKWKITAARQCPSAKI